MIFWQTDFHQYLICRLFYQHRHDNLDPPVLISWPVLLCVWNNKAIGTVVESSCKKVIVYFMILCFVVDQSFRHFFKISFLKQWYSSWALIFTHYFLKFNIILYELHPCNGFSFFKNTQLHHSYKVLTLHQVNTNFMGNVFPCFRILINISTFNVFYKLCLLSKSMYNPGWGICINIYAYMDLFLEQHGIVLK